MHCNDNMQDRYTPSSQGQYTAPTPSYSQPQVRHIYLYMYLLEDRSLIICRIRTLAWMHHVGTQRPEVMTMPTIHRFEISGPFLVPKVEIKVMGF